MPRPDEGVGAGETSEGVGKPSDAKSPAVKGVGGSSEKPELAVRGADNEDSRCSDETCSCPRSNTSSSFCVLTNFSNLSMNQKSSVKRND